MSWKLYRCSVTFEKHLHKNVCLSAYKSTNYQNNSDILCFVTRRCKASDVQTRHEPGYKVDLPVCAHWEDSYVVFHLTSY